MDDVYQWILELVEHHRDTGEILQCHYVPNLTSHSRIALEYEREFLTVALQLLVRLPNSLKDLFHITTTGRYLVVMYTYEDEPVDQPMPPAIQGLVVDQFIRPNKIPKNKLSMTIPEKPQ